MPGSYLGLWARGMGIKEENRHESFIIPGTVEVGVIAAYLGNSKGYAESVDAALYDEDSATWVSI